MRTAHTAPEAVKLLMVRAEAFHQRHQREPAVRATYGYFTHHPVAPLNRKRLTMLLESVQARSADLGRPLRVLDLACGGGLISCAIGALGHRTLGLDLSHDEIRMAKLFAGEEKLDGLFKQADLLNDPEWEKDVENILGGKPDIITLAYALHHLPDVERFADRLSRWLPSGTILLVNEENPESPLFRLKHRVRTWLQRDTETEWHRTHSGWLSVLEPRGFKARADLRGADLLPGLGRVSPGRCWSLVFSAERS